MFQSDLFPDALVTWRAVMTPEEWLAQSDKEPEFESLKPEGVQHLASHAANDTASSSTQANGSINGSPAQGKREFRILSLRRIFFNEFYMNLQKVTIFSFFF